MPRAMLKKILFVFVVPCLVAQIPPDAQIAGVWRGNSTCTIKDSPCHNEVNVYRITPIAGKPGWVSVIASKVIEGKEIVMGSSDWKYDGVKHTFESPDGRFRFTRDGENLEGALMKDNTVYRRIHLKRANEPSK